MGSFGLVAPSDPPSWLEVLASSPLAAALIAVLGVIGTIIFTNLREKDRQEHERLLKDAELAAASSGRLRDERIAAYRKMLAATSTAHVNREGVEVLAGTYAEISLLAGSYELSRAAQGVWIEYAKLRRLGVEMEKNPEEASQEDYALASDKADTAQEQFLKLAREELGVEGRSPSFRDLEGSTPGEDLPGPETETSEP